MQQHQVSSWVRRGSIAAAVALGGFSQAAQATVVSGSSSAYGLGVNTQIVDRLTFGAIGVNASVGPVPTASGVAPLPYSDGPNSVASATANATSALLGGGTINVNAATVDATDILTASASSNVDGTSGSRFAQASSAVDNFNSTVNVLGLGSLLNTANLFSFSADTLTSSAMVSGDFGSLIETGDSVIIDANGAGDGFATFSFLGSNYDITVDAAGHAAPNTTIVITAASIAALGDLAGADLQGSIRIILNEQIVTGDGISSRGIQVNALHVTFNNAGAEFFNLVNLNIDDSNLVTGDIIVAHSEAFLTAVPEPGTAGLLVAASTGVLGFRRRRRLA